MTTTTYRTRRRRTVLTVAATTAAVAVAAVAASVVALMPTDSASAAVLDAAAQTGRTGTLRAILTSGSGSASGEFAGKDSKITFIDEGKLLTVVEVGNVRFSFAGNGADGSNARPIGKNAPVRAPIAASAADVVRALVDHENVETIGDEKVRGTTTTHFRVKVSDATRSRLTAVSDTERAWFALEQVDGLRTVDVWVSDKLIRRIAVQVGSARPTVTEFFDFGAPITIKAPRF